MSKLVRPFGSWESPIDAEMMTSSSLSISDPRAHQGHIFWHESRPAEQGRGVVVMRNSLGVETDLIPAPYSARSGVHEYGGRCYCLSDTHLFFVNSSDQQIYALPFAQGTENASPVLVTPSDKRRYADLEWVKGLNTLLAVCENHAHTGEAETTIVSINLKDLLLKGEQIEPATLVAGADFYAYPRISPDQKQLCWLQWNHPQMPWFSSELWTADLAENTVSNCQLCAGGEDQAIFQPSWHPKGELYFCSDESDLWNIYRINLKGKREQVSNFEGECGLPLWQFGMQTYAFLGEDKALCGLCNQGIWQLQYLDLTSSQTRHIESDLTLVQQVSSDGSIGLVVTASPKTNPRLQKLAPGLQLQTVKESSNLPLAIEDISLGKAVEFPTSDSMSARGFFYFPQNAKTEGPESEKPPLVVMCHGGPTAATSTAINLKVQFWTSRGFAVFDVNYRGSTGFGRNYRSQLDLKWGIYDVDDACAAAEYACQQGWVDPQRTIIRGSSAGGLTVLNALAMHDTFKVGASLYGIGELKILVDDTHKFEKRYGDRLIAPWPEGEAEYDRRSPINHIDKLSSPVVFFQGLKDKVVPPEQAEMMAEALIKKGIPVAHITYPEEGHGFKSAETIVHSFNSELAFYGKILGFETDSSVSDLKIKNFS